MKRKTTIACAMMLIIAGLLITSAAGIRIPTMKTQSQSATCDIPVSIVSARSGRDHGGTWYWIDLDADASPPNPNHVESRMQGVQKMGFTLSSSVIEVEADVSCEVGTYSGTINVTVSEDGLNVTVDFDPKLPDQDRCTIILSGDISDSFDVRTLEGDVNFDKSVSTADSSSIKGRLGWLLVYHPGASQYDINTDGSISTADRSSVKGRLGNTCP